MMSNSIKDNVFEFDRFKLDVEKLMLYRDGVEVSLPPKTVKTLAVLVESRGSILSKNELIDLVWDDSIVEESNLAQYLYLLRKTLGSKPDGSPYIETLRRRGYRFTGDIPGTTDDSTRAGFETTAQPQRPTSVSIIGRQTRSWAFAAAALLLVSLGVGYWYSGQFVSTGAPIQSVAVLPFQNASGNPDIEYLTDGMTETLINGLSQLPQLSVKARSSVFHYKDGVVEPQKIAAELSVQAILQGRVLQRGDDLTLYLSLVDGRTGDQLWGEQYQRKLTDLLALQSEIARDVSRKLRARLAGADEQKVAKNYTENVEAYQLYLKGRYHALRLTPSETQRGISYYEQAIVLDPSYALAYVGLADAYRSRPIAYDVPPTELFPKAKSIVQKALELDDTLAEAHAVLGFTVFWYEWNWKEAENRYKRALELDPNSANTHLYYAHLLSETGRHPEALAEVKRALELDPLSIYANALEGQFLLHAGQVDEALASLNRTFELAPNYWLAHLFASSAYVEKGMYTEAINEGRRAKELMPQSAHPVAFVAYGLARSGKRSEAHTALEELLASSNERYVPPYVIGLTYNCLDQREETFAWLERGYKERDPRMVFLKVEPKWNNLHSDPRFQSLLRRIGFAK